MGFEGDRSFLVSIEAVSFDETIVDTDDLSTIRGASWAALRTCDLLAGRLQDFLGEAKVTAIYTGASQALARVSGKVSRNEIERALGGFFASADIDGDGKPEREGILLAETRCYLVFSHAITEESDGADVFSGNARARAVHQYQSMDIDLPDVLSLKERAVRIADSTDIAALKSNQTYRADFERMAAVPCVLDRRRPIDRLLWETVNGTRMLTRPVSASVAARRAFGRTARRYRFFEAEAGIADFRSRFFAADSLEEIAKEGGDALAGVPKALIGKMAVLSMDGNGFGKLRKEFTKGRSDRGQALGEFARVMNDKRRALLNQLVDLFASSEYENWLQLENPKKPYVDDPDNEGKFIDRRGKPILRFEVLLNGADESVFVFPAWALWLVLDRMDTCLRGEAGRLEIGASEASTETRVLPITYGIGVAVCNFRTPVRAARRLADELRDNAKLASRDLGGGEKQESRVDVMVLAGVDVPVRALTVERKKSIRVEAADQKYLFTLPLEGIDEYFWRLSCIRGEPGNPENGVARRQLYQEHARATTAERLGMGWDDCEDQREALAKLLKSSRGTICAKDRLDAFPEAFLWDDRLGWVRQCPLAPLHHLLEFWDLLVRHPSQRSHYLPRGGEA